MKNKRKTVGNILIITGLVMLLGAAGLFIFNMCENNHYDDEAGDLAERVKTQISAVPSSGNGESQDG